ncbi:serine/threonine-protein kinase, partial [Brachybacterium alimentarium]|uniref:serine/threonine-protein kinase n=1 Tax=Brachybacterium alimentarium TaxID=47845 RepID=UPI003FD6BDE5
MAELLGHYRLHEVLGVGSFATVHRAHDERLDASVAVKVLAENHSLNPEIRERFIAEGRTLRRVGGPHLVTVHDIGQTSRQQPYLVLEIADRGTLRQRVENLRAEGWRATREDALALARPLAAAVGAVHRARLVHRDLSPGNLLLTSTGGVAGVTQGDAVTPPASVLGADERLLVADLGMCKDLAVSSGLTVAAGTDGFRPPEQSRPAVVDIRADIWAMSSVLRWLVQDADLPAALHRTLERGLQEDPGARQADATTWLGEVEEALALETAPAAHEPSAASPVGPEPSSASSLSASAGVGYRLRRRAVLGALLVLALVTGLGLGSLLVLRGAVAWAAGGG